MTRSTLFTFFILTAFTSCKENVKEKNQAEETFLASSTDKELKKAMTQAQKELDYFIKVLVQNPTDTNYYFIAKTSFAYDGKIEHMWVNTFKYDKGTFTGILIDKPLWVKDILPGDTVELKREKVEDWVLFDNYKKAKVGEFYK